MLSAHVLPVTSLVTSLTRPKPPTPRVAFTSRSANLISTSSVACGREERGDERRSWEMTGGRGRSWEITGGRGRPWEAVGGRGRSWEVVGGHGRCGSIW